MIQQLLLPAASSSPTRGAGGGLRRGRWSDWEAAPPCQRAESSGCERAFCFVVFYVNGWDWTVFFACSLLTGRIAATDLLPLSRPRVPGADPAWPRGSRCAGFAGNPWKSLARSFPPASLPSPGLAAGDTDLLSDSKPRCASRPRPWGSDFVSRPGQLGSCLGPKRRPHGHVFQPAGPGGRDDAVVTIATQRCPQSSRRGVCAGASPP